MSYQQGPYPPPQQPWQPQEQYQPQPSYPPPGYPAPGYQGPQRPRRRGRTALIVIGSILGAFVVIAVIAGIAGSSGHTVATGQAGTTSPSSTSGASKAAGETARIGSTITLAGNDDGEKMAITVTRIISHGKPANQYLTPDKGKRFYAVQFRLADTGTAAYSDSPSNGAAVVDSAGQSYQGSIYDVTQCQSFPGTVNIAAGQSGLGCVVFQVPAHAKITKVQFTLDSGFGPATGQWAVRK